MKFIRSLVIAILFILISIAAQGLTFEGINIPPKALNPDCSFGENNMDEWPPNAKDECMQNLYAVIGECSKEENWMVSIEISAQKFYDGGGVEGITCIDGVIGEWSCEDPYKKDDPRPVKVASKFSDYSKSGDGFTWEIVCSFTCNTWPCPEYFPKEAPKVVVGNVPKTLPKVEFDAVFEVSEGAKYQEIMQKRRGIIEILKEDVSEVENVKTLYNKNIENAGVLSGILKNERITVNIGGKFYGAVVKEGFVDDVFYGLPSNPTMIISTSNEVIEKISGSVDPFVASMAALGDGSIDYKSLKATPSAKLFLVNVGSKLAYMINKNKFKVSEGEIRQIMLGNEKVTLTKRNGMRIIEDKTPVLRIITNRGNIGGYTTKKINGIVNKYSSRYSETAGIYLKNPSSYLLPNAKVTLPVSGSNYVPYKMLASGRSLIPLMKVGR